VPHARRVVSTTTIRSRILKVVLLVEGGDTATIVSTTTIRSRILKAIHCPKWRLNCTSFNHHDPFEDTESDPDPDPNPNARRFNHHDPFEDTESPPSNRQWKV